MLDLAPGSFRKDLTSRQRRVHRGSIVVLELDSDPASLLLFFAVLTRVELGLQAGLQVGGREDIVDLGDGWLVHGPILGHSASSGPRPRAVNVGRVDDHPSVGVERLEISSSLG